MVSALRDKKAAQRAVPLDPPCDGEQDDKKPRHDKRIPQLLSPSTAATAAAILLLYLILMSLLRRFAIDLSLDVSAMKLFAARIWTVRLNAPEDGACDKSILKEGKSSLPKLNYVALAIKRSFQGGSSIGSSFDHLTVKEPVSNTTAEAEAPPPMAAPKNWTVDEIIDHVAGPQRSLIVVPVTSNYLDFTENFFLSASKVGLGQRVLFVTVDEESWDVLHSARPDQTVRVQSLGAPEPLKGNKSEAVYNSAFFHSVVDRKPVYIRALLEKNVSVLFSDADIVLFGDPHKWFTGNYDVWVTKDTNALNETRKLYPEDLPMPLKREAITDRVQHMCSCFIYTRPTSGGKLIMDRWIKAIKDHTEATGNGTADQPMLNKALVETPQTKARVAVLPIPRFPSGCLFFGTRGTPCNVEHRRYQRQVGLGKVSPIWAHNNFIRGHDVKLRRFQDHDLWFVDDPAAASNSPSMGSARAFKARSRTKVREAQALTKTSAKTMKRDLLTRRSRRSRRHRVK